jgi:two-component system, cell cycle sensor histidine kinase and response regulator CckA
MKTIVKDQTQIELEEAREYIAELEDKIDSFERLLNSINESDNEKGIILDSLSELITCYDKDLKILYVNKTAIETLGLNRDDVVGMRCPDVFKKFKLGIPSCDPCIVKKSINDNALHEGMSRSSNGKYWLERVIPVLSENGDNLKYLEVLFDITKQKIAEEALRQSETKYRNLVEDMTVLVCTYDKDFKLQFVNEACADYFKTRLDELIEKNLLDFIPEENKQFVKIVILSLTLANPIHIHEYKVVLNNNEIRWLKWTTRALFDKDGNLKMYQSIGEDITFRKKAEEESKKLELQLYHSQKMESIGRLAGGVAHDFNNILSAIMGFAELLKIRHSDTSTSDGNAADIIFKASQRAAGLTKQLLGFAREGKFNPIPLNVNEAVVETIKVTEKIFEKNIRIKFDFSSKINTIKADKNQIDQVLTNLIINAKDAMLSGGEIVFFTENVVLDKDQIKSFIGIKEGQYVKLSITDTGVGIPETIIEKIYDPFFTTKGEGKGTGLGLATVYGIVKNHGGYISVDSEVGMGTTFTIYFPAYDKEIIKEEVLPEIINGDATILIVDDEEFIRDVTQKMLENLGYKVHIAKDGQEAMKILETQGSRIDLILLDLIMPEMDGKETYNALSKIRPDIKVLISSGYSKNGKAEEIINDGAIGFLQKPYDFQELSKAISDVLSK